MSSHHADQIVGLYRRHAEAWDRNRGQKIREAPWLAAFVAAMPASRRVLDIGCGTGSPIAGFLLAHGCEVTGVDSSPELIGIARTRHPSGRFEVADMRQLALGRRFDGLIAWNSFFHLTAEAQVAMFRIFRAHAAPGAALMFTSGTERGEAIGQFEGEPLYHASLDTREYQARLEEQGFDVLRHVVSDPDCGGLTVWLAKLGKGD